MIMKILLVIIIGYLAIYFEFAFAKTNTTEENFAIYQKYLELDNDLKKYVGQGLKSLLPYFMEVVENVNISQNCMKNIFKLTTGLRRLKSWALSFPDASARLPDGILSKHANMLGDFDQCLKTTVVKRNGDLDFRGQYCIVNYVPILPKTRKAVKDVQGQYEEFINITKNASDVLRFLASSAHLLEDTTSAFGICVPSGCSTQDIHQTLAYIGEKFMINANSTNCEVEGSHPVINKTNIVIICIISSFTCIGIIGSILDCTRKKMNDKPKNLWQNVFLCFSVTSNFQKLMDTKTRSGELSCLHGIRVLTLFWVILCHQYIIFLQIPTNRNAAEIAETVPTKFSSQPIANGFLSVDIFFLIGGLVHSYVGIKKKKRDDNIPTTNRTSFIITIILRIWRLAPSYIISVFMMFLLIPRGPVAAFVHEEVLKSCKTYWWRNVLFIQNLFDYREMCLLHSWYVAVDLQLFLLSLIPITLLIRYSKAGVIVNSLTAIGGIAITVILCFIRNTPPTMIFNNISEELIAKFTNMYIQPYPHISSYFVGVIIGYILATKGEFKMKIMHRFFGWLISGIFFSSMIFVSLKWNTGSPYTRLESSLYFAFSRFMFPLAIGWMIICCSTGNGGAINYILSMNVWVPLSRLSYTMYLMSVVLQVYYLASQRAVIHLNDVNVVWQHISDVGITALFSLVVFVLFDSPFIALQKLVMSKNLNKKELPNKLEGPLTNDVSKPGEIVQNGLERNQNVITIF